MQAYEQAALPLQWIGSGGLWIGNRNPDFLVIGQQKVVEIMQGGELRYGPIRRSELEEAGYTVLVIDTRLVTPQESIAQVWQFIHNGDRILSIERVSKSYPFTVYNLQCEPYDNFYGNMILGHNCDYKWLCRMHLLGGDEQALKEQMFMKEPQ